MFEPRQSNGSSDFDTVAYTDIAICISELGTDLTHGTAVGTD